MDKIVPEYFQIKGTFILEGNGNHTKQSLEKMPVYAGDRNALYLRRGGNHCLALPRPGPQRQRRCLCSPGTECAGVSSHRGHRQHTSWHRSPGRGSGSDTGSGAQGLRHHGYLKQRNRQNIRVSLLRQEQQE